jgi:gamma-glutamylcyclotransferase (GGCT)/AIG2-like uncharacterized protein YtfP
LHEQISIRKARFLGQAKIKGQLFQIADETYPGAIVTDSEDHIMGELFQLRDPLRALYEIDKIEGCDEGLFERKLVDVWFDSKCVKAWSYFYAKPLGASARILSGVFSINPMLKKPQSN